MGVSYREELKKQAKRSRPTRGETRLHRGSEADHQRRQAIQRQQSRTAVSRGKKATQGRLLDA